MRIFDRDRKGADESEVVSLDSSTSVGDGGVFEAISLASILTEVAKVFAFGVCEDYGISTGICEGSVKVLGIVAVEIGEVTSFRIRGDAPFCGKVVLGIGGGKVGSCGGSALVECRGESILVGNGEEEEFHR